jgi:outer membrane protein
MMIAKSRFHFTFLLATICLLALNSSVLAQSNPSEQDSEWQLSLALGAGVRTNPVMDNDDIPLILIPQVSYQGERFFIQNLDFGYTLFQNDERQINVLLTPSYDQVFFNKHDVNNFVDQPLFSSEAKNGPAVEFLDRAIDKRKLHSRRMAALAGLEFSQSIYDLDFQLQILKEITGYYEGSEARIALSKSISVGKNDVKLTLGANWQNSATLDYFYGLNEHEASGNEYYSPSSGLTGLLRFDWNYQIDEHWGLRFFTSYRHLSHAVSDSPLVTENNVVTAFAGGVYHF